MDFEVFILGYIYLLLLLYFFRYGLIFLSKYFLFSFIALSILINIELLCTDRFLSYLMLSKVKFEDVLHIDDKVFHLR